MPAFRKLEPEEVKTIENKGKGTRRLTEEQYDAFLAEYEVGDYGEATLDESENRLTVRNRMRAAANRRSVSLDFRRTQGNLIRFKVVELGSGAAISSGSDPKHFPVDVAEEAAASSVSSDAPLKRRGGRPKKSDSTNVPAYATKTLEKVAKATTKALNEVVGGGRRGRKKATA